MIEQLQAIANCNKGDGTVRYKYGSKVKIIRCDQFPELVGTEGFIGEYHMELNQYDFGSMEQHPPILLQVSPWEIELISESANE